MAAAGNSNASNVRPLDGKVAVITGARNNMGRAFTVALASLGADTVIHYHRESTTDQAQETQRLAEEAGARTALFSGDLGQSDVVSALYDVAEQQFGGVDIVVNTAGGNHQETRG